MNFQLPPFDPQSKNSALPTDKERGEIFWISIGVAVVVVLGSVVILAFLGALGII